MKWVDIPDPLKDRFKYDISSEMSGREITSAIYLLGKLGADIKDFSSEEMSAIFFNFERTLLQEG